MSVIYIILTLSQDSSTVVDSESYGNLGIGNNLGILKEECQNT